MSLVGAGGGRKRGAERSVHRRASGQPSKWRHACQRQVRIRGVLSDCVSKVLYSQSRSVLPKDLLYSLLIKPRGLPIVKIVRYSQGRTSDIVPHDSTSQGETSDLGGSCKDADKKSLCDRLKRSSERHLNQLVNQNPLLQARIVLKETAEKSDSMMHIFRSTGLSNAVH